MGYQPELGQMVFGQPWQKHECPQILEAALAFLSEEVQRVLWNIKQEQLNPFGNHCEAFRCEAFGVWSYDWSDNEDAAQPYNFCHPKSGVCISWHKYAGRGMSCNRAVNPNEVAEILSDCIEAMNDVERKGAVYSVGVLGEVPYFGPPDAARSTEEGE